MKIEKLTISDVRSQIIKLHAELEAEHNALSATWLGRPRKRHHQIVGASRALRELWYRLEASAHD